MKRSGIVIIAIVLAAALSYVALSGASSRAVESTFAEGLKAVEAEARVAGLPFSGHTETIILAMTFDEDSLLPYSSMDVGWGPSDTVLDLIKNGQGGQKECAPPRIRLFWKNDTLARFFQNKMGIIDDAQVNINEGCITLAGNMMLAGEETAIVIDAVPFIDGQGRLAWKLQDFAATGKEISPTMQEKIIEAMAFTPDLAPLDWEMHLEKVVTLSGKLSVSGFAD